MYCGRTWNGGASRLNRVSKEYAGYRLSKFYLLSPLYRLFLLLLGCTFGAGKYLPWKHRCLIQNVSYSHSVPLLLEIIATETRICWRNSEIPTANWERRNRAKETGRKGGGRPEYRFAGRS